MSAVLLILLAMSLHLSFNKKLLLLWPILIIMALFLLGSKATMLFALVTVAGCALHESKRLTLGSLLIVGLFLVGALSALWIFRDLVAQVVDAQLQRYQYITQQQGGSAIDHLLTGRNDLLEAGFSSFISNVTPLSLVVGGGISTLGAEIAEAVNYYDAFRGIEMDLFEIALAAGLVGVCIALTPFVSVVKSIRASRRSKANMFYLLLGIIIIFLFMLFGGHALTEGMPAEYLGIYLAYICLCQSSDSPLRLDQAENVVG